MSFTSRPLFLNHQRRVQQCECSRALVVLMPETSSTVLELAGARCSSTHLYSYSVKPEASSIMRVLAERSLIGTYLYS